MGAKVSLSCSSSRRLTGMSWAKSDSVRDTYDQFTGRGHSIPSLGLVWPCCVRLVVIGLMKAVGWDRIGLFPFLHGDLFRLDCEVFSMPTSLQDGSIRLIYTRVNCCERISVVRRSKQVGWHSKGRFRRLITCPTGELSIFSDSSLYLGHRWSDLDKIATL